MNSFRKWFYRPRRDDTSLMAQFYYADEELNLVAGELDSFDGRKDPERCTALVNQLRQAQDKVLNICVEMMDNLLPEERAPRDFRVKFPDDVMQETLSGQLWFGAECLAAGSSILNREAESTRMRPLAKAVTKTIENVRNLLREQCLKPIPEYTEKIRESLKIFDKLFSDFELSYVSAMVPVKSVDEYEMQQNVVVLFSDTLQRSAKLGLVTQEQIDNYDPALMFTIPRLAIIAGLVIFPDGPLNLERESKNMSELFRPFKTLLLKIRELLWTMSPPELGTLEKCLCSMEEPDLSIQSLQTETPIPPGLYQGPISYTSDFVHKFYANYPSCRTLTPEMISLCSATKKADRNDRKRDRNSSKSSRTRARQERQSERFLSRLTGVEERPRARRRSRRGNNSQPQQLHYYQYPEHFHQEVFPPPPPPPPPPTPTTHHTVPYTPREQDTLPHCNSNIRPSYRPHPRTSSSRPSHFYGPSFDRRHAPISSRYPRSRPPCPSSRHRTDRINTIICACGSSNSRVPESTTDRGCVNTPNTDQSSRYEDQHPVYADGCPYPSSNTCSVYRNPNYLETNDCHDPRSYSLQECDQDCELPRDISAGSTSENVSEPSDLNCRHVIIQNCVTNAVNADPCVLSPVAFCEQDSAETTPQPSPRSQVDPVSSDLSKINLSEESLNHERANCDDCNNVQSYCCDVNNSCDNAEQTEENALDQGRNNANDKPCLCNSKSPEVQERPTANVSSEGSCGTLVAYAPIPEPRHSHTSLRPYGSKVPRHACPKDPEEDRKDPKLKDKGVDSSLQSKCDSEKASEEADNDVESSGSTSPHQSGTEDDEEVALALQAAEVAVSWKARERFSDPGDLIQRLFVCISGVADQLQTNYASDLRKILRCVFVMNQTPEEEEVEILEGKEHFPSRREPESEDVTSTNGSEQLSVESAEDALEIIGTPEAGERINSPDEVSDIEEEEEEEEENSLNLSSSHSDDSVPRSTLHTSSVIVPPSVFNDHSLMQYSTMSPPPFFSDRNNFEPLNELHEVTFDNDSPNNDVTYTSEMPNTFVNPRDPSQQADNLVFNLTLDSIVENSNASTIGQEPYLPIANLIPVASSSGLPGLDPPTSNPQSPAPVADSHENLSRRHPIVQEPPIWVPDNLAPRCMACGALFTVVRRRHHCRNCGKVFCGHCSRHSVPLPHFGIWKNVRVCNACFLYYVTSSADGSSALS